MSKLPALLVWLAAGCASAQVTLSTVQNGMATPVNQAYDFASVSLGSVADVDFRLTNTGSQAVYLTSLGITGPYAADFTEVCSLSPQLCGSSVTQVLPVLMNPNGTLDFTVQFKPFQLGGVSVKMEIAAGNTLSVILLGTGVPGLTVLWNGGPLGAGQTVTFGNVQTGASETVALSLSNLTDTVLTAPTIPALSSGDFSLSGSALTATTIAAGGVVELDVTFTPSTTGVRRATLTIGLNTYPLQGTGVAPPPLVFPTPTVEVTPATLASAQQGSLSIGLASASAASGTGTVTLAFQSAVSGVSDDPNITFDDGTRTATFTVAVGATSGQFSAGPSVPFATGTTAGTLVFTVTLGNQTAQANIVVPAAQIGIDAAVAARNVACDPALVYCTTANIEVQVNGWDNTRSASGIVFTFYNSSGQMIAPGNIDVSAAPAFAQYFAGSDMGGIFGVHALFPVNGDDTQVVAAVVQLMNSQGSVQSTKITF
ncbi:MAG TPA: choice-of-anchor D domain-containing protein [Bryobacteraceae bacterium]|nr:choice-of-anchor D domain-containing protein [Bryobacteraceae bacterium]